MSKFEEYKLRVIKRTCKIVGCQNKEDMSYYDKPLCQSCLTRYQDPKILKQKLKIKEELNNISEPK